jgi:SdrD B-like domain
MSSANRTRNPFPRRIRAAITAAAVVGLPLAGAFALGFGRADAFPVNINGRAHVDTNHNGSYDVGETTVAGVTAMATDASGAVVGTAVTNATGNYAIQYDGSVVTGPIKVTYSGYPGQLITGSRQTVFLPGPVGGTFDIRLSPSATSHIEFGDRLWADNNGNGLQDIGEPGIPGVTMLLVVNGFAQPNGAVTDAEGYYLFTDDPTRAISPSAVYNANISATGSYRVEVQGLSRSPFTLTGFTNSPSGLPDDFLNSDAQTCAGSLPTDPLGAACDPTSPRIDNNVIPSTGNYWNYNVDFGFQPYDYRVSQNSTSALTPGGPVTIDVTVSNNGPSSAGPCTVTNLLPAGLTYDPTNPIAATSQFTVASISGQTLVLNCVGIAVGTPAVFTINAVEAGAAAGMKNVTYVSQPNGDAPLADYLGLTTIPTNATDTSATLTNNDSSFTFGVVATTTTTTTTTTPPTTVAATTTTTVAPTTVAPTTTAATATTAAVTTTPPTTTPPTTAAVTTTPPTTTPPTTATVTTTPPTTAAVTTTPPTTATVTTTPPTTAAVTTTPPTTATVTTIVVATTIAPASTTVAPTTTSPVGTNTASIGDRVWIDANGNGQQDAGELGLAGVTVNLVDASTNMTVKSMATDSTGAYLFTSLPAGSYRIEIVVPTGYSTTVANIGVDATDSDADVTGKTGTYTLVANQAERTADIGLVQMATIGDRVFSDLNANGIQDANEPGVSGILVSLVDAGGVNRGSATTDANGNYSFTVIPGTYRVAFNTPGYSLSPSSVGTDNAVDSDPDPTTGSTALFAVLSGDAIKTVDAGLVAIATTTTTTIASVTTTAAPTSTTTPGQATSTTIASSATTTNAPAVTSAPIVTSAPVTTAKPVVGQVVVGTPLTTTTTASPDSSLGATVTTGLGSPTTTAVKPAPSVANPTGPATAAVNKTCKLNSTVWVDANGNGVVDAGEQVLPGVKVRVIQGDISTDAITDANGRYEFSKLACGEVTVQIVSGLPTGTATPKPKTLKVLGEQLTPVEAPFGVTIEADIAYGGSNSMPLIATALTAMGVGGLIITRRRRQKS